MNEMKFNPEEDLPELDAFEQQWVDQLANREPDLVQTEEAFVQSVMNKAEAASAAGRPAVIARIGAAVLPYAVAAAVLLAGFAGWIALKDSITDEQSVAQEDSDTPQPDEGLMVERPERPPVQLGALIANVKSTATTPANTLTETVSEAPEALSVDRLFDLMGDSVPDLKELLAPLEPDNEQQSRA